MTKITGKRLKKILSRMLSVVLVLLALMVAYLTYCNFSGKIAFIFGKSSIKIITQSMEPTIPTGSYVLAEKVSASEVKVGDVIVFYSRDPAIYGKLNTHRVVEIKNDGGDLSFVTKGDNNYVNDEKPVSKNDVVGRYVRNMPGLTTFGNFFTNPWVFAVLIILPAAWLMISNILELFKKAKSAKMDMLVNEELERLKAEKSDISDKEKQDSVREDESEA